MKSVVSNGSRLSTKCESLLLLRRLLNFLTLRVMQSKGSVAGGCRVLWCNDSNRSDSSAICNVASWIRKNLLWTCAKLGWLVPKAHQCLARLTLRHENMGLPCAMLHSFCRWGFMMPRLLACQCLSGLFINSIWYLDTLALFPKRSWRFFRSKTSWISVWEARARYTQALRGRDELVEDVLVECVEQGNQEKISKD